jgi:hypothetical protein
VGASEHRLGTLLLKVLCVAVIASAVGSPTAGADWTSAPAVPRLDKATRHKTIATFHRGSKLGNRPNVFAKVGDSLSQSPAFLEGLGCGQWVLGKYSALRPAISLFASHRLQGNSSQCARVNSFSRNSAATLVIRASAWATSPGDTTDPSCLPQESPLACELRLTRPAYAVILLGTNDVTAGQIANGDPVPDYVENMSQIVSAARRLGVIPVLTTIPPRNDSAAAEASTEEANAGLWRLTADRHVPLINLWRALVPLPDHGLTSDRLHLSVSGWPTCASPCDPNLCAPACRSANFTNAGLKYGSDTRNLITLRTLRRLAAIVPHERR